MSSETDRQTDRQTETQRERQRQTDWQTETQTGRQTEGQRETQTDRQTDRQRSKPFWSFRYFQSIRRYCRFSVVAVVVCQLFFAFLFSTLHCRGVFYVRGQRRMDPACLRNVVRFTCSCAERNSEAEPFCRHVRQTATPIGTFLFFWG